MADRKTFASRLKEERERKGLSIYALAKASGMSKQALGKLEAGSREPAWATVQVIAKALGVSCEAFADDGIEMPTKEEATTGKRGRPRKVPETPPENILAVPVGELRKRVEAESAGEPSGEKKPATKKPKKKGGGE